MEKDNIKKALEIIPEKNDVRPNLSTPFKQIVKGKCAAHATDSKILLSLFDEELANFYPESDKPNLESFYHGISLKIEESPKHKVNVEKFETILSKVEQTKLCNECLGSGEVEYKYEDKNGNIHKILSECPICHGKTKCCDEEVEELDPMTFIKFGETYFSANLLNKTLKVLKLLGASVLNCVITNACTMILYTKQYSIVVMGVFPIVAEDKDATIIPFDF